MAPFSPAPIGAKSSQLPCPKSESWGDESLWAASLAFGSQNEKDSDTSRPPKFGGREATARTKTQAHATTQEYSFPVVPATPRHAYPAAPVQAHSSSYSTGAQPSLGPSDKIRGNRA